MSLLVFSPKCKHSVEVLEFIQKHKELQQIVQYHNVTVSGIPPEYRTKITRVPTLLTKNGKILVGREIVQELETCDFGSIFSSTLDGEPSSDMFGLDDYGKSLQPAMTRELEDKISRKVEDEPYSDIKK